MNTTPPASFADDVEWTLPGNSLYYAYRGVTTVTTLNLKKTLDLYHACYVCVYYVYSVRWLHYFSEHVRARV
jgi:hypothetical protein